MQSGTGGLARAWVALLVTREPLVYYVCAPVLFDGRGAGAARRNAGRPVDEAFSNEQSQIQPLFSSAMWGEQIGSSNSTG